MAAVLHLSPPPDDEVFAGEEDGVAEKIEINTMLTDLLRSVPGRISAAAEETDEFNTGDMCSDLEALKTRIAADIPNLPAHPSVMRLCQLAMA